MTLTKKMTLAFGLLVAGATYAQTTATSSSTGLLGQRFAEFGAGLQDIKYVSNHAYNVGASANVPVVAGLLDVGAGYSYNWISGPLKGHANTVFGYANVYRSLGGVKPFVGLGGGFQLSSTRFGGRDHEGIWGANLGVEIPIQSFTLTPRIGYADDFESSRRSTQEWSYQLEGNYWINAKSAVFASYSRTDVRANIVDSRNFQVGFRQKF